MGILEAALRALGLIGAVFPALALAFIAIVLLASAMPSILFNGWGFLYHQSWNFGNFYSDATITRNGVQAPVGASYGALPIIAGTLLTSKSVPITTVGSDVLVTSTRGIDARRSAGSRTRAPTTRRGAKITAATHRLATTCPLPEVAT